MRPSESFSSNEQLSLEPTMWKSNYRSVSLPRSPQSLPWPMCLQQKIHKTVVIAGMFIYSEGSSPIPVDLLLCLSGTLHAETFIGIQSSVFNKN